MESSTRSETTFSKVSIFPLLVLSLTSALQYLNLVEKAAAVFSLKLESGHKLLCPWIDNICDETLAYFPPTPNPVLIKGFKERSMGLLRLSALPIISQAAIELMKGPQLESFLRKGSYFSYGFDGGLKLVAGSESLDSDDVSERHMSSMYHQVWDAF